jgi:hypothetical protein
MECRSDKIVQLKELKKEFLQSILVVEQRPNAVDCSVVLAQEKNPQIVERIVTPDNSSRRD